MFSGIFRVHLLIIHILVLWNPPEYAIFPFRQMRNIIFRQVEMTFLGSDSWKITRVETRTLFQEEAKPRALPSSLGAPSANQAK